MSSIRRLAMAAVLVAAVSGTATTVAAREIRIGLTVPDSHVWARAAHRLAERLEVESGGRLVAAVFPASQLGRGPEMLQQLEAGVLDMYVGAAQELTKRVPAFNAWFVPFLFPDVAAAGRATQLDLAQDMLKRLERFGLIGLGYTFAGMRHVLLREEGARGPDDLAGKKIRISNFEAEKVWYEALGAAPVPIPLGEVYTSLQNGVIDGVSIDLDAMAGFEMYRVAKTLLLTSQMAYPGVFMYSAVIWEELDNSDRELIARLTREVADWSVEEQARAEEANLAKVSAAITVVDLRGRTDLFAQAVERWNAAFADIPEVSAFREAVASAR